MHTALMQNMFGKAPVVFQNNGLIFTDNIADTLDRMDNFQVILIGNAGGIAGINSSLYLYRKHNYKHTLMYEYQDTPDTRPALYLSTVDEFMSRIEHILLTEGRNKELYLNILVDFDNSGDCRIENTNIYQFFGKLPEKVLKKEGVRFALPSGVHAGNNNCAVIGYKNPTNSRTDFKGNHSVFISNDMQKNAAETLYDLLFFVKQKGDDALLETFRKLTSSDHLQYMGTEYFRDGEIHTGFSPYSSPEDAYLNFLNAIAYIEELLR